MDLLAVVLLLRRLLGVVDVLFVDADLLEARVARLLLRPVDGGGREGFEMLFVTFPSGVRREFDFAFYFDLC